MGIRSYIQQALQSTVYYGSNANRSITPSIAARGDRFFNYTSLLLDGDGTNGAQNNTFLDSSTNNFTITRSGNTTQGSFSPFGDNWSNYFDGSGDYLTATGGASFNLSSGDWTVEAWVYVTVSANNMVLNLYDNVGSNSGLTFWVNSSNQLVVDNGLVAAIAAGTVSLGQWVHIAASRVSGTTTAYVNGTSVGTTTQSPNTAQFARIGILAGGVNYPFNGYISNLRIVKGTALYTSNFTPPTAPLTAVSGTSLLTCQSNRFLDASTNNFTITRNGDVRVQSFNPFGLSSSYSPASDGASGYFDGNTDFLSTPTSSEFNFSGQNFTIETWIYPTSAAPANATSFIQSQQGEGNWYALIRIGLNTNNTINVSAGANGDYSSSETVTLNAWNHIAMVKSGSNVRVYLNGVQTSINITVTNSLNTNLSWWIGKVDNTPGGGTYVYYFSGFISNIRILKGTALYTSNFTPPTGPLSAVTNTSLLLNFANSSIYDKTKNNVLETVGNAQVSTTQKKYGTGALYFDGTGDYLSTRSGPHLTFGGDFTIEAWVYITSLATYHPILEGRSVANYSNYVFGIYNISGTLRLDFVNAGGATGRSATTTSVPLNTWTHVAWVRSGGITSYYVNGVKDATTNSYSASLAPASSNVLIGALIDPLYFNGYIDELRVTNGIARYTANFTPPTKEFASIFGSDPEDSAILASGGTISFSGGKTIHTFTSPGTFSVTSGSATCEMLVVAGGGGGGGNKYGAGGGAGGLVYSTNVPFSGPSSFPVQIGQGGAGGTDGGNAGIRGSTGGDTIFGSAPQPQYRIAKGGGGGGSGYTPLTNVPGDPGGSGGGAASGPPATGGPATQPSQPGASGTDGFGNAGGTYTGNPAGYAPSGGGGAGGAGVGSGGNIPGGGNGGIGREYSISGTATYYAGGGGASLYIGNGPTPSWFGLGGLGGGGRGNTSNTADKNGAANTGGGGGGAHSVQGYGTVGGNGGSGIIIISYPT